MDLIKNKFFILLFFIGLGDCDDVQERAFSGYVLGGLRIGQPVDVEVVADE